VAELFVSRRAEADLRSICPEIGALRSDLRHGMRMLVEGNYPLLYEYDSRKDEVDLIAVIDGRREFSGLF
jgi:plasmid stabilization system protein ParE